VSNYRLVCLFAYAGMCICMVFQIQSSPAITRMKGSIVNFSYLSIRQCPDVCVFFQTLRGKRSAITLLLTFWAFLFLARRSQSDIGHLWLARALGSEPCIFAPIIFGDMAYLHTLKYVAAPTRPTRFPTPIPSTPPGPTLLPRNVKNLEILTSPLLQKPPSYIQPFAHHHTIPFCNNEAISFIRNRFLITFLA